jgi:hypothetical protein
LIWPGNLPEEYGEVINAFAKHSPELEWANEIGNTLIQAKALRDDSVKGICRWILNNVEHGSFPVDLRFVAHSLLEMPTLRISSKEGYVTPPILKKRLTIERRKRGLEHISEIPSPFDFD